jgi:LmbE family N-acetylglucosaminyl deacetylase
VSDARLLVVAPHPDDDTIGCGGAIASLASRGGAVCVVYVTDGSASHRSGHYPPPRLAELREREARAALAALGNTREPVFLRVADGSPPMLSSAQRAATLARLAAAIEAFAPQLVLAPWPRDPHPDHIACAALTQTALARVRHAPRLGWYQVWLQIRGTPADFPGAGEVRSIDVALEGDARARKRHALFEHRSQTGLIDDDPDGFCIDEELAERWLGASERFFFPAANGYDDGHAHRIESAIFGRAHVADPA